MCVMAVMHGRPGIGAAFWIEGGGDMKHYSAQ
jgi:hypothetical protein